MENRSHALVAGLFALILGLSAVAALWWFGGKKEATNQYVVLTKKNITGLNVQAQVRYRGIRVGKVERISFDREDFSQNQYHAPCMRTVSVESRLLGVPLLLVFGASFNVRRFAHCERLSA